MKCPECGGNTKIIETRDAPAGTRRRHKCEWCCHRFTTIEISKDTHKNLLDIANCFKQIAKIVNLEKDK